MNQGVLGIYAYVDSVIEAIHKLKRAGHGDSLRVFSPVPNHDIEHAVDLPESPLRFLTLFGALLGAACGFAFTILTSLDYPISVSAKPIAAIPPYMIIVFELTILFGALSTFLGLIVNSLIRNRAPITMYDERFSDDKFGVMVVCSKDGMNQVEEIMKSTGAEEVKFDRAK